MTLQEAIQVLDNVGSQFQGSRQDHLNIQIAVSTLRGFISAAHENENKTTEPNSPEDEKDAD